MIRSDVKRADLLVGEELSFLGNHKGDTDTYLFGNHVYFFRRGKRVLVSMMVAGSPLLQSMEDKTGIIHPLQKPEVSKPARSQTDNRHIEHDADIEIEPEIYSFLQTGYGWYHRHAHRECERLFSWKAALVKRATLRAVVTETNFPLDIRYFFHAGADLIIGCERKERKRRRFGQKRFVETVKFACSLEPDETFSLYLRKPRSLWGSISTSLEVRATAISQVAEVLACKPFDALAFIVSEYTDEDTVFANRKHEPYPHIDLPDTGVVCYESPQSFIFFYEATIVDVVLNSEDSQFDEVKEESVSSPDVLVHLPASDYTSDIIYTQDTPSSRANNHVIMPPEYSNGNVVPIGITNADPTMSEVLASLLTVGRKARHKFITHHKITKNKTTSVRQIITQAIGRMDTSALRFLQTISQEKLLAFVRAYNIDGHPGPYGNFYVLPEFVLHVHSKRIDDVFFIQSSVLASHSITAT